MKQTFEEYVLSWWQEFVESHESEAKRLMETFIGEEETIEDYLEDGETPLDWLSSQDNSDEIYKHFFGSEGEQLYFDDLPDTEQFLTDMFKDMYNDDYDFVEEFIEDMVDHAGGYDTPLGFFKDLSYGGCASGMIPMLIYNSDCKEFYCNHIDSMENFVEDCEEELGERLSNKDKLPHYVFVCWFCYEEFGYKIARQLYPETF